MRKDGRTPDELRPVQIETDFIKTACGSCLISTGDTRVICTASVEETVPPFLKGKGSGWVTAEYAMLPGSTSERKKRDGAQKDGRSVEIQRLIGRSLRQAVDMSLLGERTIIIDCDVIQADGGTRTASITGAMVALTCAVDKLIRERKLLASPIVHQIAAVSCGLVDDEARLDLCYEEDSRAQVDMNFVMNDKGGLIELQGTGEGRAFSADEFNNLIAFAQKGITELMLAQRDALEERADRIAPMPVLILASENRNKIRELRTIFRDYFTLVPMSAAGFDGVIDESSATFAGNAAIKAETVSEATGLPTIADDSGLVVEALDGEPGVLSARYAGEHGNDKANNDLLLARMKDRDFRAAEYVCNMALKIPGMDTIITEGKCKGVLLEEPRGTGGFGYDPLFLYEPAGKTFAEMNSVEKNEISHRAEACRKMKERMKELIEAGVLGGEKKEQ